MAHLRVEGEAAGWDPPVTVSSSERYFVNWADFPSVVPLAGDTVVAHWLLRGPAGGYDYGVRVAWSHDGGRSWSEPWTPHEDGTPQEHGFVSLFADPGGATGVVWLDGRDYQRAEEDTTGMPPGPFMQLRYRVGGGGQAGPEVVIDSTVCDCCQTDVARTREGAVVVYRDRTAEEVRDIYAARWREGRWDEPTPVHRDGWVLPGCPVNGPAADADGDHVVVAWFTAADEQPRVRAAFSSDGGRTFSDPIAIDEGRPAGRVDAVLLGDGSAAVVWLERTADGTPILARRILPDGTRGAPVAIGLSTDGRASGFPRVVHDGRGGLVFAWTDVTAADGVSRVRSVWGQVPP